MALERTMGEWEPWRWISMEMVGQSTTATLAKEEWSCWKKSDGHLELYFESPRIHSMRVNIHRGRVLSQMDIRVTIYGEGTVAGRQVQQALQLLTERQGRKQETHPNDKREVIGSQVLKSTDRVCTQRSKPEMLQTLRRWPMLVVWWNDSPDTGEPRLPLQPMERRTAGAWDSGWEGDGLESELIPEYPDLWTELRGNMWSGGVDIIVATDIC